jgi:hypothetical protein
MEMAAIAATKPPTMAPVFELSPPEPDEDPVKDGLEDSVKDGFEDSVKDGLEESVKDELEESVKDGIKESGKGGPENPARDELGEAVDTPEGPKIAPGPYSGLSISNVGEIVTEGERKDRRHDAHHLLDALRWRPNHSLSGVCCEYVVVEEKLKKQTVTSRVAQ